MLDIAVGIIIGATTRISENLSSLEEAALEREVTSLYKSLCGCRDTIASFKAKLKQMNTLEGA